MNHFEIIKKIFAYSFASVSADAFFRFSITDGYLTIHYPSTIDEPNFSINESGHLIFTYEGEEGEYDGKYEITQNGHLIYNL